MSLRLTYSTVSTWCGGILLTPNELAGPGVLAATPAYLDDTDLVRLLVLRYGTDGARAAIEEYEDSAPAMRHGQRAADPHDDIVHYWDRQP